METNNGAPLTYEAFAALYRSTFAAMMSYSLKQVGSDIYCAKLAALADEYPEWAEIVEGEQLMDNLYSLNAHAEPAIWTGPRRPSQDEIDAALVEHFERPRNRVLELRRSGVVIGTVAHEDYEPWDEEPRDEAYERAAARYDGSGRDWR
jgi:hypothetical protein